MWSDIRVLILEDDRELLKALGEVLEDAGFRPVLAASSEAALQQALEEDFEVIVTDIRMAGMDGLEALASLQRLLPEIRSLVITGFSSENDTIRALRLGVGEYLQKPFSLDDFTEAVKRLATQARELQGARRRERSMRRFLLWSLQAWSSHPRSASSAAGVGEALQWCSHLAQSLGFEPGGIEALQVACLCEALASQLPEEVDHLLPPGVSAILRSPGGVEREVLEAARLLAQGKPLPSGCPEAIRWAAQTRLPESTGEVGAEAPAQQRRAALSLAWQWEQTGQHREAHHAYTQLQTTSGRESWLASLGLARLARLFGHQDPQAQNALRAVEQARQLGPLSLATASLEAGILLVPCPSHGREARQLLEESLMLHESLGFSSRSSLARAALAWQKGEALPADELTRLPADELRSASWWLLPYLQSKPTEAAQSLVQRLAPRTQEPAHPPLRILSLGSMEVYLGPHRAGEEAFRKNQKARLLLVFLACERGRFRSDEVLSEMFWPEEGARGRKNLYSLRSILRKALGGDGELDYVQRTPQGLCLNPNPGWSHDWEDLHEHLRQAVQWEARGELNRCLHHLREAAQLYRGPFLESCYMDWAVEQRRYTEARMLEGLQLLARLTLEQAALAECREVCQRLLDIDPLHQAGCALWMKALLEEGRPEEALRLFERMQKALKRELQCEPEIALLELQQRARLRL